MGRKRRPQPKYLGKKLRLIRKELGLGLVQMAQRFEHLPSPPDSPMISRFERGEREPNLLVLLEYARLAGESTDLLIDDKRSLPKRK